MPTLLKPEGGWPLGHMAGMPGDPSPTLGESRMNTMHLLENPMHSTTEGGKVCLQQKKKRKNRHITEDSVKFLLNFKIKLNGLGLLSRV